jgi:hypothetical protein
MFHSGCGSRFCVYVMYQISVGVRLSCFRRFHDRVIDFHSESRMRCVVTGTNPSCAPSYLQTTRLLGAHSPCEPKVVQRRSFRPSVVGQLSMLVYHNTSAGRSGIDRCPPPLLPLPKFPSGEVGLLRGTSGKPVEVLMIRGLIPTPQSIVMHMC